MTPVHFVSFGTLPEYQKALARIESQANCSGYFATVRLYNQQNTPGIKKFRQFVCANRRGYG